MKKSGFLIFCAGVIGVLSIHLMQTVSVAEAETSTKQFSYGQTLSNVGEKFYDALCEMKNNEILKSGKSYEIKSQGILKYGESYTKGNPRLSNEFERALKSFQFDNPDLFYIDYDNLTFTITQNNGSYHAYIGSGRGGSYILDEFSLSLSENIADYENKIASLAGEVQGQSAREKVVSLNNILTSTVTLTEGNSAYDKTSYGCLVNKMATSEGVAKLFKSVLDKLNIENCIIEGYLKFGDGYIPQMWNYVNIDGFHAVDVGENILSGINERTLLSDKARMSENHIESGDVFSKGRVSYPSLAVHDLTSKDGKFTIDSEIIGLNTVFTISYDGKGEDKLEESGMYLAFRENNPFTGETGVWKSLKYLFYSDNSCKIFDNKALLQISGQVLSTNYDFVVLNCKPDGGDYNEERDIYSNFSNLSEVNIVACIGEIENIKGEENFIYKPQLAYANIKNVQSTLDLSKRHIELSFNQSLVKADESQEVGISVTSENNLDSAEFMANIKLENVQFDGVNMVSFDFTPSRLLKYNNISYTFQVENLIGKLSNGKIGKEPKSVSLEFGDTIYFASKNGKGEVVRLIKNNVQAGVRDKNGNVISEEKLGEIELAVLPEYNETLMKNKIEELYGQKLKGIYSFNLKAFAKGQEVSILNGGNIDFMLTYRGEIKNDKSLKAELYHFDVSSGELNIESMTKFNCVYSGDGVVASVDKLGDYILVFSEREGKEKNIFVDFDGVGGEVTTLNKTVFTLVEGESLSFILSPKEGYEVFFVGLNGKILSSQSIELEYDNLTSENTLIIRFIPSQYKNEFKINQEINYLLNYDSNYIMPKEENRLLTILFTIIFACLAGVGFLIYFTKKKKE